MAEAQLRQPRDHGFSQGGQGASSSPFSVVDSFPLFQKSVKDFAEFNVALCVHPGTAAQCGLEARQLALVCNSVLVFPMYAIDTSYTKPFRRKN